MSPSSLNDRSLQAAYRSAAVHYALMRSPYTVLGDTVPLTHGSYFDERTCTAQSPQDRLRHTYLIGSTGSGKTNLLSNLIRHDFMVRTNACVVDLHGDLVDVLTRILACLAPADVLHRFVLVDLRDESRVTPFNPLAGAGNAYERALALLAVIQRESPSWGVQLEETMRNSLMAIADAGGSLLDLEPLLTNGTYCASVLAHGTDLYVKDFFRRFWELSDEKRQTFRLPVLNKITPLLSVPPLRRMFGLPVTLPLADLFSRTDGTILLVALGVDRLHEAAQLAGALFIAAVQNAMMTRMNDPAAARRPVMLYIDEFGQMASDRFGQIVAEGRRAGIGLTLANQNLSQIPPGLLSVIRNNVQTQVYFRTGAQDAAALSQEAIGQDRDGVRAALLQLPTGEAILARRGMQTVRIRVPRFVDPPVSRETFAAVRAAGLTHYSVTAHAADEHLSARRAALDQLAGNGFRAGSGSTTLEVRHARTQQTGF